MADMNVNFYQVTVACTNCEYGRTEERILSITRGQLVADTPCPLCDCFTLGHCKWITKPKQEKPDAKD